VKSLGYWTPEALRREFQRGESLTILNQTEESGVVCFKRENTLTDMLPRYEEAQGAFED